MIIVDTSVWIDFFNGAATPERSLLRRMLEEDDDVHITEIILTEILQGIRDEASYAKVRDCLLEFPVIQPRGIQTYIKAADIFRSCRRRGRTVRATVDCIIAAICLENSVPIFHKDGDFEIIRDCAGLKTIKT